MLSLPYYRKGYKPDAIKSSNALLSLSKRRNKAMTKFRAGEDAYKVQIEDAIDDTGNTLES